MGVGAFVIGLSQISSFLSEKGGMEMQFLFEYLNVKNFENVYASHFFK